MIIKSVPTKNKQILTERWYGWLKGHNTENLINDLVFYIFLKKKMNIMSLSILILIVNLSRYILYVDNLFVLNSSEKQSYLAAFEILQQFSS